MRNDYKVLGEDAVIYLKRKNGDVIETLVSADTIPKIKEFDVNWYAAFDPKADSFYVQAWKEGKTYILHRLLFDYPKGKVIDHINHNTLDNRMSNLRAVNYSGNGQNRKGAQTDSKSGIRGIHWIEKHKRWRVQATIKGKKYYIGLYSDLEKAKFISADFRNKFMPYSIYSDGIEKEIDEKQINDYIKSVRFDSRMSSSKQKYIYWHKATQKWLASPIINSKKVHLGVFETIEEAVKARDEAMGK